MRLQPYKHMSLKQQKKENKLAPKYYSPYKFLKRIGSMDYKLELQRIGSMDYKFELPPYSCVLPVFHVSFLNKVINNKILVQTVLPEMDEKMKIILEPKIVLETWINQLINRAITEYLIK